MPGPAIKVIRTKDEIIERDWCENAAEIGIITNQTERGATHASSTGQLPSFKEGGNWRMRPSTYFRYLEGREREAFERMRRRREAERQPTQISADP